MRGSAAGIEFQFQRGDADTSINGLPDTSHEGNRICPLPNRYGLFQKTLAPDGLVSEATDAVRGNSPNDMVVEALSKEKAANSYISEARRPGFWVDL